MIKTVEMQICQHVRLFFNLLQILSLANFQTVGQRCYQLCSKIRFLIQEIDF